MPIIYVNDSGGNTWRLGIDPDGRGPSARLVGAGQPVPPVYTLRASDGGTGHSYQITVDTDGRPGILEVAYSAANPTGLLLTDVSLYTWNLQINSDPRFVNTLVSAPSIVLPKIVYPSSVMGVAQDPNSPLYFQRQPRKVPAWVKEAVRHDNKASSGVQEVVYERTDRFMEFEMEYVGLSNFDINNWEAFEESALQGIPFDYYPDPLNSPTVFTTFFLDDQKMNAAYKFPGQYTFKHRFYQYVNWP